MLAYMSTSQPGQIPVRHNAVRKGQALVVALALLSSNPRGKKAWEYKISIAMAIVRFRTFQRLVIPLLATACIAQSLMLVVPTQAGRRWVVLVPLLHSGQVVSCLSISISSHSRNQP